MKTKEQALSTYWLKSERLKEYAKHLERVESAITNRNEGEKYAPYYHLGFIFYPPKSQREIEQAYNAMMRYLLCDESGQMDTLTQMYYEAQELYVSLAA